MKFSLIIAAVLLTSILAFEVDGQYKQTSCTCNSMCNNINGFSDVYNVTRSGGKLKLSGAHPGRGLITAVGGITILSPTMCSGYLGGMNIHLTCLIDPVYPKPTRCQITYHCTDGACTANA